MSEAKTPCPRCGYVEGISVKPMTNAMAEYVDKTGKSVGIMNTNDKEVKLKDGSVVTRKDLWVAPAVTTPPTKK
jgi:hypothetical protein